MVKDALVSFWSSKASMERGDFVGSGFFIAPGRVLTAAHVVNDPRPLWLRPEAGATQDYAVERVKVCKHDSLDVAIVPLPVMPAGAFSLRPWTGQGHPQEIMLNGFFEGRKEEPHPYTVLSFDSVEQHFLLDSKQPEGQSGSAACVGDRVWGITVCHYIDPNIARGCAIALSQVWDWLVAQVPGIETITPPPDWGEWVGAIRQRLQTCFDAGVFSQLFTMYDGLPKSLAAEIAKTDPATVGERAVEALLKLAEAAVPRLVGKGSEERRTARQGMLAAMNLACALCFDPARLPPGAARGAGGLGALIDVEAGSAASAALATCADRHACWKPGVNRLGVPVLDDERAHVLPLEIAEGDDRKKALALFAHLVTVRSPVRSADIVKATPRDLRAYLRSEATIDKATQRDLRAYLRSEAKRGRAHLLVLEDELRPEVRRDLEAWIQQDLGISVLLRRDPEGDRAAYYYCDEADLLASIREFVSLLSQPEWNPS